MTWLRFLLYVVFTLIAFAGLVLVFAWFQNWIDCGHEEGPPEPPHGDAPKVPEELRGRW